MVGGVASNTLAIPGVPSGQQDGIESDSCCATYQLDDWSPSPMDDFRSIEAGDSHRQLAKDWLLPGHILLIQNS